MQDNGFSYAQQRHALFWLVLFHMLIIASSNYLVQFPFTVTLPNGFEVHSTWGALTFPFIFLATDLTVRIFGQRLARRIVFFVMFPALALSYALSVEISSVVYSISRRILKHEHAQKHPPHPAPPTSHLAGLHAGEGKRHLPGTPLPSQPRHHLPRT